MRKFILTISLLGGLVPAAWCVPQVLNFQGRLLESGALVNGSRTRAFKIFDAASGGSPLFTESRNVNVSTGVFNVLVGDVTTGGIPLSVFDGGDRYIEVQVGAQTLPRQRVVSVGYSFKSQSAAFATESSTATFAQRAAIADSVSGASVTATTITATNIQVTTITVTNIIVTSGTVSGFLKVGKNTIILGETPLTGGLPNTIAFTGGNATIKTQAPSEGTLTLEAGGAQHIVLNPGGNVGIGTVSPGTKLDVASGGISSGKANTTTGGLALYNASSPNATVLQAGNATAAVTYKLPPTDGAPGDVLATDGAGNLSWRFVPSPFAPTLTSLTPTSGSPIGGTSISLSGTNFLSGASVLIGGNPATSVAVPNSTLITAVTPSGAPGFANVTVSNPDNQAATIVNGFAYLLNGCTDGTEDQVFVAGAVVGCNGAQPFSSAGSLCAAGWHGCRLSELPALNGVPGNFPVAPTGIRWLPDVTGFTAVSVGPEPGFPCINYSATIRPTVQSPYINKYNFANCLGGATGGHIYGASVTTALGAMCCKTP
jgi:hypothetical protein